MVTVGSASTATAVTVWVGAASALVGRTGGEGGAAVFTGLVVQDAPAAGS